MSVAGFSEHSSRTRRRPAAARSAFTLLETMMALVIVGVGVVAFVDAQASFIRSNAWSSHAATGMLLANEVREMSRRLARHDPVTGLTIATGTGGATSAVGWGRESGEAIVEDFDDLDDLDGLVFGLGGTLPGPVDAFGQIVQEVGPDGEPVLDSEGQPRTLEGWSQRISVTKVDPYNFGLARSAAYEQTANAQLPAIRVNQFPLRVTVVVEYTGPYDTQPSEVTRMTWVVPP
jgi:prepilin-type N-terminal cleavage/methylation domain-containing protein